jgi:hypothetical protein
MDLLAEPCRARLVPTQTLAEQTVGSDLVASPAKAVETEGVAHSHESVWAGPREANAHVEVELISWRQTVCSTYMKQLSGSAALMIISGEFDKDVLALTHFAFNVKGGFHKCVALAIARQSRNFALTSRALSEIG